MENHRLQEPKDLKNNMNLFFHEADPAELKPLAQVKYLDVNNLHLERKQAATVC